MRELEYPFDAGYLLKKKKGIKRELISNAEGSFLDKRIAVLGGATTNDIRQILELFLLNNGIRPAFYESEYNQYYEDIMFGNDRLEEFQPDLIYICTSIRNIKDFPDLSDTKEEIERKRDRIICRFTAMWDKASEHFHCPIIQNNFEYPYFRLLGNMDAGDIHGRVNFINELNRRFYGYARQHPDFHICDINYLSAVYGLDKWSDPYYWHMYKYAAAVPAIPFLSFQVANIIKSIYGKNKKVLNLDLDNTLWGGTVGDDGADQIEIGQETPAAQVYSEFQEYLKLNKQLGVLLTINSKNEEKNAGSGLKRPDSILHEDDFVSIKANWNPKSRNLGETAEELHLLPDSFVFVDDNPAERELIRQQFVNTAVPELEKPEHYLRTIDRSGFFEPVSLSGDDLARTNMYQENAKRCQAQTQFVDYEQYLASLEMKAEIQAFIPAYMNRIAQLTNKSNQFNLTTKRYTQSELEHAAEDGHHITLYGKLKDKFGDNGVVSVLIGTIKGTDRDELHMELWLMSCRVLKRKMEYAMMDALVHACQEAGIKRIYGYYYPTKKNGMVKNFYQAVGFQKISESEEGNTVWIFLITENYVRKQNVIEEVRE